MAVAVFTLGGTISMAGADGGTAGTGVVARLGGAELLAGIPGLADLPDQPTVHDVGAAPSASLSFRQVLDVARAAADAVESGAPGAVVTQGTDTLEEVAYLVDLVWPSPEPIVVTGAMRNPTMAGPDGPANLLAAVRVAGAVAARGLGALVVFNDEIHAARWVRKQHSSNVAAFRSPDVGPLGHVVEGDIRVLSRPARPEPLAWPDVSRVDETRVALYTVCLDDDGRLLENVADSHDGLVVAALGAGHVSAALATRLGAAAERIPVVLTSRTGAGPVLRRTYGAVGSEIDLQRRGLVTAGYLDPMKARVLLRLLLAGGATRQQIADQLAMRG